MIIYVRQANCPLKEMSGVTHHDPELDFPVWSGEAHRLPAAYDRRAHDRRAVGSQIYVLNSVTRWHATSIEGDGEGFRLFVHRRIPLRRVFIW